MNTPQFTPDPDDQNEAINSGATPTQRDAITPWDLYASAALKVWLTGIIRGTERSPTATASVDVGHIVSMACETADAMIAERNKRFGSPE